VSHSVDAGRCTAWRQSARGRWGTHVSGLCQHHGPRSISVVVVPDRGVDATRVYTMPGICQLAVFRYFYCSRLGRLSRRSDLAMISTSPLIVLSISLLPTRTITPHAWGPTTPRLSCNDLLWLPQVFRQEQQSDFAFAQLEYHDRRTSIRFSVISGATAVLSSGNPHYVHSPPCFATRYVPFSGIQNRDVYGIHQLNRSYPQ